MREEFWLDVVGFENLYMVSNNGIVKNSITGKILKNTIGTSGYYFVNLYKNKKQHNKMIHKLVCQSFFNYTPTSRKIVIDHIDNNKLNNYIENLQIISNRSNSIKDKKPKSGYSCIYLNGGSYLVRMRVNNKKVSLGTFKNIEDAIKKRDSFFEMLK